MSMLFNLDMDRVGYTHYLRLQEIRNLKGYFTSIERDRRYTQLQSNINGLIEDVFNEYLLFEKTHNHRNYKGGKVIPKKYQHVQGYCITYMLPPEHQSLRVYRQIIKEIMFEVTQGEPLPFVGYLAKLGEGLYLRILVLDRQYQGREPKRYLQDEIRDAQGKRRKEDFPGARVIGRKGDIVLDKSGNIVWLEGFKQIKSRIFKEQFSTLLTRLKQIFLSVVLKNVKNVKQVFTFRRDQVYYSKKSESIKVARRRNQVKRLMERWINFYLSKEKRRSHYKDIQQGASPLEFQYTDKGEQIVSLFYKTKARFDKGTFTDQNKEYSIFRCSYSECLINLERLKEDFMLELTYIMA